MEIDKFVDVCEEIYRWIKAIDVNNPSRNDHYKELPNGILEIQSAAFSTGKELSADVASINLFDAEKTKRAGIDTDGVIGLIVGGVIAIVIKDEYRNTVDHYIIVKHNPEPDNEAHALICIKPCQNLNYEISSSRSDKAFRQLRKSLAKLVNANRSLRVPPKTIR